MAASATSVVAERLTPAFGSFISLTSMSEIRYEGFLCYHNPHDSTIGLQHVKCFGTEGRWMNGPQVSGSDRIFGYIYFRCSSIKDVQVISSPSPQSTSAVPNDPVIIECHFAHPSPATTHHGAANVSTINIGQLILPITPFQFPPASSSASIFWWTLMLPPPPAPTTVFRFDVPNYWAGGFSPHPPPPQSLLQASYPRPVVFHQNVIASVAVGSSFSEHHHSLLPTLLPPFLPTPSVQLQSNIPLLVSTLSSSIPIPNNGSTALSTVVSVINATPAPVTINESGSTSAEPTIEEQSSPSHSLEDTAVMEPTPSDSSTEESPRVINAEIVISEDDKERMDDVKDA